MPCGIGIFQNSLNTGRFTMDITVKILENEYWYGLGTFMGTKLPVTAQSSCSFNQASTFSCNQEAPFMVSSLGRYIWSEYPFDMTAKDGNICITKANDDIKLYEGFGTLKGAYLEAAAKHFPADGKIPPENFFIKPQYNTWAELIYDQIQEKILGYAHGIVENDLPAGILMIDDGWMRYYGSRQFNLERFPDVKGMLNELHSMGFEVMLWVCPFISPDSAEFRELSSKNMLVKNADGTVAVREWWNGFSGVLDMSNPKTVEWFDDYLNYFIDLGFDGFKLDAGDVVYYRDDDITYGNVSAHDQCRLWCEVGLKYPYNEYRASYKCGGLSLVQRQHDKAHRWDAVASLVPNALAQGIMGYPYNCPDMIGGGSFTDFLPGAPSLKPEIFARYAQASALMPMMQYSAAPWRVLDKQHAFICSEAGRLHAKYADKIIKLAREYSQNNEPILRYMEYEFPNQGFGDVTDQFMLGSDILCAPVVEENTYSRSVKLPCGSWKYVDGTVYEGGKTVEVASPIDVLPYFERV